jgi:crossover junction endodeoxyribonuclease RuvC
VKICAIDPGIHGAIALIAQESDAAPIIVSVIDIPVVGSGAKERVNVLQIQEWLLQHGPTTVFIERTQAFPLQGRSSAFKFGRATGALEAVVTLCGIALEIVEPAVWKRFFRLPGKDKEAARQKAISLFPAAHHLFARRNVPRHLCWRSMVCGPCSRQSNYTTRHPLNNCCGERAKPLNGGDDACSSL